MSKSLQDQLLKSGLISGDKAKKAKTDKRKQQKLQKQKGKKAQPEIDQVKAEIKENMAEKKRQDAALNRKKQEQYETKAIQAQIKQLIESNIISSEEGDIAFSFTQDRVIKKIYVSQHIQNQLSKGRLAIVKSPRSTQTYELIPKAVAEKIKLRDSSHIVFIAEVDDHATDENDPYANYQIPDDLMW